MGGNLVWVGIDFLVLVLVAKWGTGQLTFIFPAPLLFSLPVLRGFKRVSFVF